MRFALKLLSSGEQISPPPQKKRNPGSHLKILGTRGGGGTEQVPCWGTPNIRRHRTKFSHLRDLALAFMRACPNLPLTERRIAVTDYVRTGRALTKRFTLPITFFPDRYILT
jgi:hypothetical protein